MKFFSIVILYLISSCSSVGDNKHRSPAAEKIYSSNHILELNLPLSELSIGLEEAFAKSKIVKKLEKFYLDPQTKTLFIKLRLNFPLESLFSFTEVSKIDAGSSDHTLEIGIKFDEFKNLFRTKYIRFQVSHFEVDERSYLNEFELVLGTVQTLIANSDLTKYLLFKDKRVSESLDSHTLLSLALEENIIRVFPTTKKIAFKIDPNLIGRYIPFSNLYQDLNIWKLYPVALIQRNSKSYNKKEISSEDAALSITIGKGEPTEDYIEKTLNEESETAKALKMGKNADYLEFSNIQNIEEIISYEIKNHLTNNDSLLAKLLTGKLEQTRNSELNNILKIKKNQFSSDLSSFKDELKGSTRQLLNLENIQFVANPDETYNETITQVKKETRMKLHALEEDFSRDYLAMLNGEKTKDKAILQNLVSQRVINHTLNSLSDIKFAKTNILSEVGAWLNPKDSSLYLKGNLHLPLNYIISKINNGLDLETMSFTSKMTELKHGVPFELKTKILTKDHGILGIDLEYLKLQLGHSKKTFNKSDRNQKFLFDLTKLLLANSLSSLKIEIAESVSADEKREAELRKIANQLELMQREYPQARSLNSLIETDIKENPFNFSTEKYIQRKKEILLGSLISFNETSKLLEVKLDPSIIAESIDGVKNDIQVWDILPMYDKIFNNTFLELSVGSGNRSNSFIQNQFKKRTSEENRNFSTIRYGEHGEQTPVDFISKIQIDALENIINKFLNEMKTFSKENTEEKAKENPGEVFYDIENLSINIISPQELQIEITIAQFEYSKSLLTFWRSPKLKKETHTIQATTKLTVKEIIRDFTKLENFTFTNKVFALSPTKIKVKTGSSSSTLSKALAFFVNGVGYMALQNQTINKYLLKLTNNFIKGTYKNNENGIKGSSFEKMVRVFTHDNDICISLNPHLLGASFSLNIANEGSLKKIITQNLQEPSKLQFAFTVSPSMARNHKVQLAKNITDLRNLSEVIVTKKLEELVVDPHFIGELFTNSDNEKLSLYNQYLRLMVQYDQVLNLIKNETTLPQIKALKESEKNRFYANSTDANVSISGSEVIYFAANAKEFISLIDILLKEMNQRNLTLINFTSNHLLQVKSKILNNIYQPLMDFYRNNRHRQNRFLIQQDPSYWTYQVMPDVYFSEYTFKKLVNESQDF